MLQQLRKYGLGQICRMKRFSVLVLFLFIFGCQFEKENSFEQKDKEAWGEEEGEIDDMGTRDYAQYGTPQFTYTGPAPTHYTGLLSYINDGDNNSFYRVRRIVYPVDESGDWYFTIPISTKYIAQLTYITVFYGFDDGPSHWYLGFDLQYYHQGHWHNLYTQSLTLSFTEAKTTRNYTNGGAGFEDVSKIRVHVSWRLTGDGGSQASCQCMAYTLAMISDYFPGSGIFLKTNDGMIELGRDTALGTHKLRFYDGAAIRAIPLQTVGSRHATNIMIYDGAATKALCKVFE